MPTVKLKWASVEFRASKVSSWQALKREIDLTKHTGLLSARAVYVVRISRPFAFAYGELHSPVVYIGKGKAQQRLTSHLKSWIPHLSQKIPDLKIKIYFCEPKVRGEHVCEGVEADLIQKFIDCYGDRPLRNRNTPTGYGQRDYIDKELHVLHPGKGPGFYWALRPLRSSRFHRAKVGQY
jgi:hypothetical protein